VVAYPPSLAFYLGQNLMLSTYNGSETRSNYIEGLTTRLRGIPDSSLKPFHWWKKELQHCPRNTVFLLRTRNGWENERRQLSAKLPLLYRDNKYEAYGPCGARDG